MLNVKSDRLLDSSFSGDGKLTTNLGRDDLATSVVLQPDGKILLVGVSDGDLALARYNTDGNLDSTFGF